ncbi:uncharacterized protein CMU_012810 [Cryptosporidium muris RN66]|uniref:Oocyst wall protein n=1 Tax=Cryptosporidium muris (strain RN66) TaxID=441375 RepID=B6AEJ0_CRYMR|nr:uncharacterized protein CMU_012810 [Cryptosporidium muris RN66]EEA06607.1 hypothetical protein, conserved [Cryptosporidium muris RN66]|eukprot:XP_002140956.1 hypothetical protein [Cryptosporidium muris RN66]
MLRRNKFIKFEIPWLLLVIWVNFTLTSYSQEVICTSGECATTPLPVCPLNGIYSIQEKGCVITEPIIKSCPPEYKPTGVTQCSRNIHTEKIITCPTGTTYMKYKQKQGCYFEIEETPECEFGFMDDGEGGCYALKDAQIYCDNDSVEELDGCYKHINHNKQYNCYKIPDKFQLMHSHNKLTFVSSTAFLDGDPNYKDDGSPAPVCKIKVFHTPKCPPEAYETSNGECILKVKPEVSCPQDYTLRGLTDIYIEHHASNIPLNQHHELTCEKIESIDAISECPPQMIKKSDNMGVEVCILYKEEIPQICPNSYTFIPSQKLCIKRYTSNSKCDHPYIYKNGHCHLPEIPRLDIRPDVYCTDPDAVIVRSYCVKSKSEDPILNCPPNYNLQDSTKDCIHETILEPIKTCPPRYSINKLENICERKIKQDCSKTEYIKQCSTFRNEIQQFDTSINLEGRYYGNYNHRGHHNHHGHHHENHHVNHLEIDPERIIHQCTETPKYIEKLCTSTETTPIIYICPDGKRSSVKIECKVSQTTSPILSCPKGYNLVGSKCEMREISSIQYSCPAYYSLSTNKEKLPYCIPNKNEENEISIKEALHECPYGGILTINESKQYECVLTKQPRCNTSNCKTILKRLSPQWKCPNGYELDNSSLNSHSLSLQYHHTHSSHDFHETIIQITPKCISKTKVPVIKQCANPMAEFQNGMCIENVEMECPIGGCEAFLEFAPELECKKGSESLGPHNADLCREIVHSPFLYRCDTGGKLTQYNKCTYTREKTCKHENCKEYNQVEGSYQCPPGYSEVRYISTALPNVLELTNTGNTNTGIPRKLMGPVRPISNMGQCTALEFTPYTLSCPNGYTEAEGKCIGVVDPTYQCPKGTYMRKDGYCVKVHNNTRKSRDSKDVIREM